MTEKEFIQEIKELPKAVLTVDKEHNLVKASTLNAAFQLYNEGAIDAPEGDDEWPPKPDTWFPIRDSYGYWVLNHEFPTTKGDEFIDVVYIN